MVRLVRVVLAAALEEILLAAALSHLQCLREVVVNLSLYEPIANIRVQPPAFGRSHWLPN